MNASHVKGTVPWARLGPPENEYEPRPSVISKAAIADPTAVAEHMAQHREPEFFPLRRPSSARSSDAERRLSNFENSRRTSFLDGDLVLCSSEVGGETTSDLSSYSAPDPQYPYRTSQIEQLFEDLKRTIAEQKHELFSLNHYIQQCRTGLTKIQEDNSHLRETLAAARDVADTFVGSEKEHSDTHKRSDEFQQLLEVEVVDNFNLKHRLNVDSAKTGFLRLRLGLLDTENRRLRVRNKRDKVAEVGDVVARLRAEVEHNDTVILEQREQYNSQIRQMDEELEELRRTLFEIAPDDAGRTEESRTYSYCESYEEEEEEEDAEPVIVVDDGDERMARVRRELEKMRRQVRREMRASKRKPRFPLMFMGEQQQPKPHVSPSRSTQSGKILLSSFIERAQPVKRKEDSSTDEKGSMAQSSEGKLKLMPVPVGTTTHLSRPPAPPKGVSKQGSGYVKMELPAPEAPSVHFATRTRGATLSHQSMVSFGLDAEMVRQSTIGDIPTPKAETVKLRKLAIPKKRRPSASMDHV